MMSRAQSLTLVALILATIYAMATALALGGIAAAHPGVGAGASLDLTVTATLAVYLLAVRPKRVPSIVLGPVYVVGLAVARLLFGEAAGLAGIAVGAAELVAVTLILLSLRKIIAEVRAERARSAALVDALETALLRIFPVRRIAALFATEITAVGYALFSWRRRTPSDGFSMHREQSYLLVIAVLAFLLVVESAGVHFLVMRLSVTAAWLLTALSAYGLLWIVGDAQAVRLTPVRWIGDELVVQQGVRWRARVPRDQIAGAEAIESRPDGALRLGVLRANVLLTLRAPITVRGPFGLERRAERLALTVDRRSEFLATLPLAGRSEASPPAPPRRP
jgi:hypothetical protein